MAATKPTAQSLADTNSNDGAASVAALDFPDRYSVHVATATKDARTGAGALGLVFAPLLGIKNPTLTAEATASWGSPAKGRAVLPVAFPPCSFRLDGTIQVLQIAGSVPDCPGSTPGHEIPGGFGWLDDPTGSCTANVDIAEIVPSKTGVSLPSECASVLAAIKDTTVILPVFGEAGETGSNGWFKITGWAAFTLVGWNFPGDNYNNTTKDATCKGDCKGLIGKFVRFVSLDDAFTPGGPDLGTSIVRLTK